VADAVNIGADVSASLSALAVLALFVAVGVAMIWRPRYFVARFVKNTTARWPRRERPTSADLAKVSDSDVLFWRGFGVFWLLLLLFMLWAGSGSRGSG